jgi:hypothetical protein
MLGAHSRKSVRQLDAVGVSLLALVLLSKNPFKPSRLSLGNPSIHERGLMTYYKRLAAAVTPNGSHFKEIGGRPFSGLALLYCHCFHLLNFSDSALSFDCFQPLGLFKGFGQVKPAEPDAVD